jgi:hypothetical protein
MALMSEQAAIRPREIEPCVAARLVQWAGAVVAS